MIRVAIADDSPFTCRLLAAYLEEGGCTVAGIAHDLAGTLALVERAQPDVLTLDLGMPGGHGLDLLQTIAHRTAVVVISGITRRAAATTLRALELGAIDFVLKCSPGAPVSPASLRREIVAKVTAASTAQQANNRTGRSHTRAPAPPPHATTLPISRAMRRERERAVIVIGASTGGPPALTALLAQLPADFSTPCLIVQHLPAGFTSVFAAQLARVARLPVREIDGDARLQPGHLLVTPGGRHIHVAPNGRLDVLTASADDLYRPSIDAAMISAAESYGAAATGVILSGMGCDGAEGLSRIRARGGRAYVQAPDSCVMASMPARALERAGADFVGAPEQLGAILAERRRP